MTDARCKLHRTLECPYCFPDETKHNYPETKPRDIVLTCICGKCHIPNPSPWEEEFDKKWGNGLYVKLESYASEIGNVDQNRWVKDFIHRQIQQAILRERDRIKLGIGGLRQWVNEKPKDLMMTSRDIEFWLDLEGDCESSVKK